MPIKTATKSPVEKKMGHEMRSRFFGYMFLLENNSGGRPMIVREMREGGETGTLHNTVQFLAGQRLTEKRQRQGRGRASCLKPPDHTMGETERTRGKWSKMCCMTLCEQKTNRPLLGWRTRSVCVSTNKRQPTAGRHLRHTADVVKSRKNSSG